MGWLTFLTKVTGTLGRGVSLLAWPTSGTLTEGRRHFRQAPRRGLRRGVTLQAVGVNHVLPECTVVGLHLLTGTLSCWLAHKAA